MPTAAPSTPDEHIASLPSDRRAAISAVRDVVRRNLPRGFGEATAS